MSKKTRLKLRQRRIRTASKARAIPKLAAAAALKARLAAAKREVAAIDRQLRKLLRSAGKRSVPYEVKPENLYPTETLPPSRPISTIPVTC